MSAPKGEEWSDPDVKDTNNNDHYHPQNKKKDEDREGEVQEQGRGGGAERENAAEFFSFSHPPPPSSFPSTTMVKPPPPNFDEPSSSSMREKMAGFHVDPTPITPLVSDEAANPRKISSFHPSSLPSPPESKTSTSTPPLPPPPSSFSSVPISSFASVPSPASAGGGGGGGGMQMGGRGGGGNGMEAFISSTSVDDMKRHLAHPGLHSGTPIGHGEPLSSVLPPPPPPSSSSPYPTAIFVPPPEELITMGITLEEYQRRAVEAEAEARAQRDGEDGASPPNIFVPYWMISCCDLCADKALVFDSICCPCCLISADCQALLHPERTQNPLTSNCSCPLAACLVCLSCTGFIASTSVSSVVAQNCLLCCPGCVGVPVINIAAVVIRCWIRRRYHIHGFVPSSTISPVSMSGEEMTGGGGGGRRVGGGGGGEDYYEDPNPTFTMTGSNEYQASSVRSSCSSVKWKNFLEYGGDVLCGLCCVWCALIHHHRELVHRGVYKGTVVLSNSRSISSYTIR